MRNRSEIEKGAQEEEPTLERPAMVHHILKLGLSLEVLLDIRELLESQKALQLEVLEVLRETRDATRALRR